MPLRTWRLNPSEQASQWASRYGLRPARRAYRLQHPSKETPEPGQHVHLSTADPTKVGFHPWLNIGSARWLKFGSAPALESAKTPKFSCPWGGLTTFKTPQPRIQVNVPQTAFDQCGLFKDKLEHLTHRSTSGMQPSKPRRSRESYPIRIDGNLLAHDSAAALIRSGCFVDEAGQRIGTGETAALDPALILGTDSLQGSGRRIGFCLSERNRLTQLGCTPLAR